MKKVIGLNGAYHVLMMLIWLISLHDISVRSPLKLAGAVPKTLIQPLNKTNTLEHFGGWNPQTEAL